MWPGAVGIALMSFTESIAAGACLRQDGEPRPVPNQELLAIGARERVGGLFGAMPAGGGTTQTAVNRSAGARTQMAELVTAAASLATVLLLAPFMALMPNAVLAAVVVVYSVTLVKPSEFREIARVRKTEFRWALIAVGGVAVLGTLRGILVAVIASLLALAHQAYSPRVYVLGRKRGTDVFRPLVRRTPRRRDVAGTADPSDRGPHVLRQRPTHLRPDLACTSRRPGRPSSCSTAARCSTSSTPR